MFCSGDRSALDFIRSLAAKKGIKILETESLTTEKAYREAKDGDEAAIILDNRNADVWFNEGAIKALRQLMKDGEIKLSDAEIYYLLLAEVNNVLIQ